MSYSCVDFTDDILAALQIAVPGASQDCPEDQAGLALAEIRRRERVAADLLTALAEMVRIYAPTRGCRNARRAIGNARRAKP